MAHVGMLSLMFAATEQRDGKKTVLAQSVECFALKLVSSWTICWCYLQVAAGMDCSGPTASGSHGGRGPDAQERMVLPRFVLMSYASKQHNSSSWTGYCMERERFNNSGREAAIVEFNTWCSLCMTAHF